MTRIFRAIRFPFTLSTTTLAAFLALGSACALADTNSIPQDSTTPGANLAPGGAAGAGADDADDVLDPAGAIPGGAADVVDSATADVAWIERPLHRLYCVEYARLRSGLQIFGDARTWWRRAQNVYAEFTTPATDAVMVFAGSRRIARGHLAVVTRIVSPREIRVDQANWQNRGEIDRNTPVLDVSANNDWSQVRVWNMASGKFGARIYTINGFIARPVTAQEQASVDSTPLSTAALATLR